MLNAASCHVTASAMASSRTSVLCSGSWFSGFSGFSWFYGFSGFSWLWPLLFFSVCFHFSQVVTEDTRSCEELRLGQYPTLLAPRG